GGGFRNSLQNAITSGPPPAIQNMSKPRKASTETMRWEGGTACSSGFPGLLWSMFVLPGNLDQAFYRKPDPLCTCLAEKVSWPSRLRRGPDLRLDRRRKSRSVSAHRKDLITSSSLWRCALDVHICESSRRQQGGPGSPPSERSRKAGSALRAFTSTSRTRPRQVGAGARATNAPQKGLLTTYA